MNDTSVWFDLCIGQASCDEDGGREYRPSDHSMQQIAALNIDSIDDHRKELHKMLDDAINLIGRRQT